MRLIIVSNRLPVSVEIKNEKISLRDSAGGVATGLLTYLAALKKERPDCDYLWAGWPGAEIPEDLKAELKSKLSVRNLELINLSKQEEKSFYGGFCNDTLWPLFHSFSSMVGYNEEEWQSYKLVNERFADELIKIIKPDDIIWIHDYHLMLLPKILKDRMPGIKIGFFLHTPFPVFEIYRLLPDKWRKKILQGILGADLVGFHAYDYKQYFLGCVQRILGFEQSNDRVMLPNRNVKAGMFPIGIDFNKFYEGPLKPEVIKEKQRFKKTMAGLKLVLSLDRLDYSKGIEKRLQAFELFLERYPEWQKKVAMILVIVPSRCEVKKYQEMKKEIDELVGRINGRFGSVGWMPIHYQYKSVSSVELSALYSLSDVALLTPLRDGMNLVAKEYIASRRDQTGVLILSEMAGAASELGEALMINPNHIEEIASALKEALELPESIQIEANRLMQSRLKQYDIVRWGNDFLKGLKESGSEQEEEKNKPLLAVERASLIKDFQKAKRRLLLLDYDGSLVPFAKYPMLAEPDDNLKKILSRLASLPNAEVVVITGRDRKIIYEWLGDCGVSLSAEHGVWIKEKEKDWKMTKSFRSDWKESVFPLMRTFVDRVPGSFLEEKEFSLVWHYRLSDPELGSLRAKELASNLLSLISNSNFQVMSGNKIVEARATGTDKGTAAGYFLEKNNYDFILGLGDDLTDEDLFRALPNSAWTLKVGPGQTSAKHIIDNPGEAVALLGKLTAKRKPAKSPLLISEKLR